MAQVRMIFVGGFLGAGKTTLLAQAARRLTERGQRVGLLTNDQAGNLVDTGMLRQGGFEVQEVCGGCFCCRFADLVAASGKLIEQLRPDVLLGEPVGSCTDISATVLQPIKGLYGDWFRLSPFSVLADPARLREAFSEQAQATLSPKVLYVFRKQLEEADLIVLNKADTLSADELADLKTLVARHCPELPVLAISALTGEGVDAWLDWMLADRPAGQRIAEVDYDTYADGEAALGWLNATVELSADAQTDWRAFTRQLLTGLQTGFLARPAEIAHVKLLLAADGGSLVANLTSNRDRVLVRGVMEGDARKALLLINARVHTDPDALRSTVEACLQAVLAPPVHGKIAELQYFSPSRPNPTHRFDSTT